MNVHNLRLSQNIYTTVYRSSPAYNALAYNALFSYLRSIVIVIMRLAALVTFALGASAAYPGDIVQYWYVEVNFPI